MANLCFAAWLQFATQPRTAIVMTVILGIGALYFAFAHLRWAAHIMSPKTAQVSFSFALSWSHVTVQLCAAVMQLRNVAMHSPLQATPVVETKPQGLPFDWHLRLEASKRS